jgi:hypothetical protein
MLHRTIVRIKEVMSQQPLGLFSAFAAFIAISVANNQSALTTN